MQHAACSRGGEGACGERGTTTRRGGGGQGSGAGNRREGRACGMAWRGLRPRAWSHPLSAYLGWVRRWHSDNPTTQPPKPPQPPAWWRRWATSTTGSCRRPCRTPTRAQPSAPAGWSRCWRRTSCGVKWRRGACSRCARGGSGWRHGGSGAGPGGDGCGAVAADGHPGQAAGGLSWTEGRTQRHGRSRIRRFGCVHAAGATGADPVRHLTQHTREAPCLPSMACSAAAPWAHRSPGRHACVPCHAVRPLRRPLRGAGLGRGPHHLHADLQVQGGHTRLLGRRHRRRRRRSSRAGRTVAVAGAGAGARAGGELRSS
jgi:hypothetical protein